METISLKHPFDSALCCDMIFDYDNRFVIQIQLLAVTYINFISLKKVLKSSLLNMFFKITANCFNRSLLCDILNLHFQH